MPDNSKTIVKPDDFSIQDLKDVFNLKPSNRGVKKSIFKRKGTVTKEQTENVEKIEAEGVVENVMVPAVIDTPVTDENGMASELNFDKQVEALNNSNLNILPKLASTSRNKNDSNHNKKRKKSTTFKIELSNFPPRSKRTVGAQNPKTNERSATDVKVIDKKITKNRPTKKPLKIAAKNKVTEKKTPRDETIITIAGESLHQNSITKSQIKKIGTNDQQLQIPQCNSIEEHPDSTTSITKSLQGYQKFNKVVIKTKYEEYTIFKFEDITPEARKLLTAQEFKKMFNVENLLLKSTW